MTEPARGALPVDPETDRTWRPLDRAVVAAVFAGGALGGLARYAVQAAFPVQLPAFPWPTLIINCSGAFALAVLLVVLRRRSGWRLLRPLIGTGFLGGWTTFSAVVATADQQLAHDHPAVAVGYLAASVGGGLSCAVAGFALAGRSW